MSKTKKIFLIVLSILFLFITILSICYIDNTNIEYEYINVIEKEDSENIRILQLSDMHFPKVKVDVRLLIENIKTIKPDIILITGDLINRNADVSKCGIYEFIDEIKNLATIFYVTGNHEEDNPKSYLLYSYLKENNVIILDNESYLFRIKNKKLLMLGLSDESIFDEDFSFNNIDNYDYSILLAHRPDKESVNDYVSLENEVVPDLIFSGHFHGGQVRVFKKGLFVFDDGLFPKYNSGIYEINNLSKIVVSRGIGSSIFPFRINNQPHVVIIDLKI